VGVVIIEPGSRVAIIGRAGSLDSLADRLETRSWDVVRVESIETEPVLVERSPAWLRRRPVADAWIVTSRAVVDTFLRLHEEWLPSLRTIPAVWAVGPDTERQLREVGFEELRVAPRGGARDLLASLGAVRGQRVLYLRSDRAGPEVALALRRRGALVIDRVVYRVRPAGPITSRRREEIADCGIWVVTSPTALAGFRRAIGAARFDAWIPQVRAYALGERTARACRAAGGRRVSVPVESSESSLTRLVVEELGDGPTGLGRNER
jgi:uroporphyrinogen-III synthase